MAAILNGIMKAYLRNRFKRIESIRNNSVQLQEAILQRLLRQARKTTFGRAHGFDSITNRADFVNQIAIQEYEAFVPNITAAMNGTPDMLWPGQTKWFAKSSGTTSNQSKFLPISKEMLRKNLVPSGWDALCVYYQERPDAQLFAEKSLIYGGSLYDYDQTSQTKFGDVSAIMIDHIPKVAKPFCVPEQAIALEADWEKKLMLMSNAIVEENITMMSGVPTWNVVLFNHLLDLTGKEHIHELWPQLQLYLHGGVSFDPYRKQFKEFLPNQMDYLEVYNASEGYFGLQDQLGREDMLLLTDNGVYFEFLPFGELKSHQPKTVSLEDIQIGECYAIVISTCAGLWRYLVGDTIEFTSIEPYRFRITGRTNQHINVFGEELMISNVEKAIAEASQYTNASVCEYTVAPIFLNRYHKGGHEWVIEFYQKPDSLHTFTTQLDKSLQQLNHDYAAKRYKGMALQAPVVRPVQRGSFHGWMKSKGKLGGQHKVPRLSNERNFMDEFLRYVADTFAYV